MGYHERLIELRKKNNYTQEELAGIIGVSRQAISKWESGMANPDIEKLIKLSEIYGCSIDYIIISFLMYQSKADHLSYLGSVYVSACVLSFTPLVVWSVTTPKITSTVNTAFATTINLFPSSFKSNVYPNTAATACTNSSTAGIIASQNCLFFNRTSQLIFLVIFHFLLKNH